MTDTGSTPGPWELSTFTRPDGNPIKTVEDVAHTVSASAMWPGGVAELWGVTIPGTTAVIAYTGNGPTREANARLIAAAPDLLAACKAFERYHATDFPGLIYLEEFKRLKESVRAAILKAECV